MVNEESITSISSDHRDIYSGNATAPGEQLPKTALDAGKPAYKNHKDLWRFYLTSKDSLRPVNHLPHLLSSLWLTT